MMGPTSGSSSGVEAFEVSQNSASSTRPLTAEAYDKQRLDALYSRISMFLMPTFVVVVLLNQLDRHNISFAALTMNRDLGFNAAVYGLGSALFFIPMCVCQVPSNVILMRVGVPRWLGFLVFSWGVIATCSALIHDKTSFYVLRLLLGVFESGAAPAMWYAVSQFYPQERLTRPYMWITSGILLSAILGAPLAAGFLSMEGLGGLRGWQWLFILEGIPSVVVGILLAIFLPESPLTSSWLSEEQKELFKADMLRNQANCPSRHQLPSNPWPLLKPVLTNWLLLLPVFAGFAMAMGSYAFLYFSTIIVASLLKGKGGLSKVSAAAAAGALELKPILLMAIPCAVAGVLAWAVAAHSQKRNEVYWHSSICLAFAGVMYMAFPFIGAVSVAAGFLTVVLFASAVAAASGPLLSAITRVCEGPTQVMGMPYYNSIAILGGFVGPYLTGALLQRPNGLATVCIVIGALMVAAAGALVLLRHLMMRRDRLRAVQEIYVDAHATVEASDAVGAKDIEALGNIRKDSGPDLGVQQATDSLRSLDGRDAMLRRKDCTCKMLPLRS